MYAKFFKRPIDFMLSLCALVALSPVLLVLTVLGAYAMRGNPFFTQLRPGKDEKIFKLIKFRTMTNRKDKDGNLLPDEQRLTKYGKILRSTSLDELPELFNILKGDMSIVGPRPLLVRDCVFMTNEQKRRHTVRSGLTGFAQINGRNNITWEEKIDYDLQYIDRKITLAGDLKIILQTVINVLKMCDTVREGTASDIDFGDWLLKEGKVNEQTYLQMQLKAKDLLKCGTMQINGWTYYNHSAIPTTAPHKEVDLYPIKSGRIWKIEGGIPLLARWTTEFDCTNKTNWWYVIKDTPFDINSLKAKRRYEINKGIKNFDIKTIDPKKWSKELYDIQVAAYSSYPKKYRPKVNEQEFFLSIKKWDNNICLGAFCRETNELCGYAVLVKESDEYIIFNVMKTDPKYENKGINAALVEGILRLQNSFLVKGGYISDGARSIYHDTNFQDYLEKYFGFRKAYCRLHIAYNPKIKMIIKFLYPFRKILLTMDGIGVIHSINAMLMMEEICRN